MHFAFIPYGEVREVEQLLGDMKHQQHQYIMSKDYAEQWVWLQGGLRMLPFGVYEYVFPKQDLDKVLATFGKQEDTVNRFGKTIKKFGITINLLEEFRKLFDLKPIPTEYKTDKKYVWITENVRILPIGIREEGDMIEPEGTQYAGWKHEAI
jgi:hypothetical protein